MNFNIAEAYLTNDNGVVTIKYDGKLEDRINDVHILIDNMGILTVQYNDYNFRYNKIKFHLGFGESEDDCSFIEIPTYSFNEVLPDYIEEIKYTEQEQIGWKFWPFIGKYKEKEKTKLRVKEGQDCAPCVRHPPPIHQRPAALAATHPIPGSKFPAGFPTRHATGRGCVRAPAASR